MSLIQSRGNDNLGRVPPILLASTDADNFCREHHFFDENHEISWKSTKTFHKYRKLLRNPDEDDEPPAKIKKSSDTVGAIGIFINKEGDFTVAGSSSGGLLLKKDGRIGSAATTGAGFWADKNSCATTSGNGEQIIRQEKMRKITRK